MPYKPVEKKILLNGLAFHYLDWGNTQLQPVLLLHGFTGHAHVWDEFALDIRKHYHVIALNQRGHGDSQWPPDMSYSIDAHFSDITLFIQALDLNGVILAGHSMGGRNALFYTACRPRRVSRLVLIDARPGNNDTAADALKRHINGIPDNIKSLNEASRAMQTLYPFLAHDTCIQMLTYGFKQNDDGTLSPKCDLKMGTLSERHGCQTENLWPFLDNISCQALIVRGRESKFLSHKDAQKMRSRIPNAVFKEIPDASHMPVQENPEGFKKAFLEFLA